jgi:nitroreductase
MGNVRTAWKEWHATHAAKQAYISFGLAIAAAAEQKVDATPMEGFNNAALDELLGFAEKGLKSVVILPLGYRENGDWLVILKKYRTPKTNSLLKSNKKLFLSLIRQFTLIVKNRLNS